MPIFLEVYEEVFTRARYMGANNRKEVQPMSRKQYDTPRRKRVVKTRLTEEEYADFAARLAPYGISQSEFIRRAIRGATIRPVVTVSPVNDELLSAIGMRQPIRFWHDRKKSEEKRMGKLIRLGATALSMIGILVMILCVQAAILFVRLCIRRKQKKIELK